MTTADRKIDRAWKLLRTVFALVPFLAGLDKFFGLIADWEMYLSPAVSGLLPVAPATFLHVSGVVEMSVGLLMLTRWTRFAAYAAAAWLLAIAGNLVLAGMFYDIAVRDVALALAAIALAWLTEARAAGSAPAAR